MKFASALQKVQENSGTSLSELLTACCESVKEQLAGQPADLVLAFISPAFVDQFAMVNDIVLKTTGTKNFIGCSASGFIGGGQEVELEPAVAVTAANLPDVDITAFHLMNSQLPDLDAAPDRWSELMNVRPVMNPHFILIPDPYSFQIDLLMQGLDYAFNQSTKIGGMASGGRQPGANALYVNEKMYRSGAVGVALSGNFQLDTIVAQGCRPVGNPMRVTRGQKNFIFEIEGQSAVTALHQVIGKLTAHEQELAQQSLFLGIAMDEFRDKLNPGDFLIRNIVGIEPNTGALLVNEFLRNEQTIQFHVRDAATSADDLRLLLKQYRDHQPEDACGVLLFSCLGRGQGLYGMPNHDSDCLKEYLGPVPTGGFFCNGEIGPVGDTTFLHGYTSAFGIFTPKHIDE